MRRYCLPAFLLSTALFGAEGAVSLDHAWRRDVPDAILDMSSPARMFLQQQRNESLPPPSLLNSRRMGMEMKFVDELVAELAKHRVQTLAEIKKLGLPGFSFEPKGPKEDEEARRKLKEGLSRKISVEFADTPLDEVISFLKTMGKINIQLDPAVLLAERNKTPITFRAQELSLETVLSGVSRLADLKWVMHEDAIWFTTDAERGERRAQERAEPRDENRAMAMPKLHAKLADGTELDVDAPLLQMPGVGQQLLDRIMDPAKDGILAFRLGHDFGPEMSIDRIKQVVNKVSAQCRVDAAEETGILLVSSESPGELRKVLTALRALRPMGPDMQGGGRGRPDRPDGPMRPGPRPEPKQDRRDNPPGQF